MKYPIRNNHESSDDFIHLLANEMIKRGTASITNTTGTINKCLCLLILFLWLE
jgi:hypothetical protein